MKKLAIFLALMLIPAQAIANSDAESQQIQQQVQQQIRQQTNEQAGQVQPKQDEEYLLKYNIRDLEAAPWLHDGKRSYN